MDHKFNARIAKEVRSLRRCGFVVQRVDDGDAVRLVLRKDEVARGHVVLHANFPFQAPVTVPDVGREDWSSGTRLTWWLDEGEEQRYWTTKRQAELQRRRLDVETWQQTVDLLEGQVDGLVEERGTVVQRRAYREAERALNDAVVALADAVTGARSSDTPHVRCVEASELDR